MHSLSGEIEGFSKSRLRKQCTRVTTVTGRKLLERHTDAGAEVEELEEGNGCGFVEDQSLDLQVGVVRPFLLLASQDAAHDMDTLQRYQVSHVLNVAYGVADAFLDQLVYKTVRILDLPETDIASHVEECGSFIDRAREQDGVVLVHCNAGVSRSAAIVTAYLMWREGLPFDEAYRQFTTEIIRSRLTIGPCHGGERQQTKSKMTTMMERIPASVPVFYRGDAAVGSATPREDKRQRKWMDG
ncbi:dual specificity protein phosphatase 19-like isoform X2 [Syngnathoides biaculeatus]|uniref:dual specificity protein phosphatase 19-like isoform X2 n=1 Tax=Syngnathoides biaculeatus TaxID=300417 RepID=UPI002ADD4794|nr:dual specificity protein phosphatase 19-like isoform X2 [Syngnathoides biaculeatus]